MRACAGSYTPHGRSQCAWTLRLGLRNACNMKPPPSTDERLATDERSPETYPHGRKQFAGAGAGALVALGLAWACLRWRPSRVQIEGGSMAPTLVPGDWALVATPHRFAAGDVVVVEH